MGFPFLKIQPFCLYKYSCYNAYHAHYSAVRISSGIHFVAISLSYNALYFKQIVMLNSKT